MPEFIEDLKVILGSHSALIDAKKSLHVLFNTTNYGCEKDYPVAVVHERSRIKEASVLKYFKDNYLLDEEGLSYDEYPRDDLTNISYYAPKYIQNAGFILSTTKEVPHPTFLNKFKHDYWKKIQSVEGLEAVIEISALSPDASDCEAEEALRAIIRKRKEVHQLKKIAFVWIVEIPGENSQIETVMKHYFEKDVMVVKNGRKTYYLGWSTPLQSINMRYFVCPPE
ncbi:MAG: hypothetical protein COB07_10810 [Sulfurovum sp.]|nr:MAG: hypothetical protein COB07_10810 [Sulfurovum sp.]